MYLGEHLQNTKKKIDEAEAKAKKYPPQTLFEPNWKALNEERCPFCENRIYLDSKGFMYRCKSKKHKSFQITKKRYDELINSWEVAKSDT